VGGLPPGIKAVAITSESLKENPRLWDEVDRGKYQIVYACPEILLSTHGHFSQFTVRPPMNTFMKNLVLVAIDECHLIWDWEAFRTAYRYIGNIRHALLKIPFVCLSATLTPNVAAYIHEVCHLQRHTIRFRMSIRRDNINTVVIPVDGDGIDPLLDLVVYPVRDLLQIPKTLIFHDNIDNAIAIMLAFHQRLPDEISGVPVETVVRVFYGSLDAPMKSQSLSDIITGKTRITICTDAFGLGVNVKDIARVIQWHVDHKLTIFSLYQRIGRAARNPALLGTAIIYIKKSIAESVPLDWSAAWNETSPPLSTPPALASSSNERRVYNEDDILIVPLSKGRDLTKFALPVEPETMDKVDIHVNNLYIEARSIKDAHQQAKKEINGTRQHKLSMAQKIDPCVLWFLCTSGCRPRAALTVFRDHELFENKHKSWCCDPCAHQCGLPGRTTLASGVPLEVTMSYLRTNPDSNKIILLGSAISVVSKAQIQPNRPSICTKRLEVLQRVLYKWRTLVFNDSGLPTHLSKSLVLPDSVLEYLVKHVTRIVTVHQLQTELKATRFDIHSSLIKSHHLPWLLEVINTSLTKTLPMETEERGILVKASLIYRNRQASQRVQH
jgi:superfamily II DNA/RNA helicase